MSGHSTRQQSRYWSLQIRPSTGTPDMKESISLGFHTADRCPSEADCAGFSDAAAAFMAACQDMSMKLMSCFAIGLGFPEHFFSQVYDVMHCPSTDNCLLACERTLLLATQHALAKHNACSAASDSISAHIVALTAKLRC